MEQQRKARLVRAASLINGVLFLMGGIQLMGEDKLLYGTLQLLAAMLNLAMLVPFKNDGVKQKLNLAILFMNIVVSLSVAINYQRSGSSYIQYAWAAATVMAAFAFGVQLKRITSRGKKVDNTEH